MRRVTVAAAAVAAGLMTVTPAVASADPVRLTSQPATSAPAVASSFPEGGTPGSAVFYCGPAGDVLHRMFVGGRFGPVTSLGGRIVGAPGAAGTWWTASSPRTLLAVRGTDNRLWMKEQVNEDGGWSRWYNAGGLLAGPAAVAGGGSTADFYVEGADHGVWVKRYGNIPGTWSGWTSLGGRVLRGSGVAAAGYGGSLRSVTVVGVDHRLWTRNTQDGVHYGRWLRSPSLPPASEQVHLTADRPATVGTIYIREQGSNRLLAVVGCCGEQDWVDLGGVLTSGPGSDDLPGPNPYSPRGDVAVRGADGRIWVKSRTGFDTWSGWRTW